MENHLTASNGMNISSGWGSHYRVVLEKLIKNVTICSRERLDTIIGFFPPRISDITKYLNKNFSSVFV
jgi:hypothetical protein